MEEDYVMIPGSGTKKTAVGEHHHGLHGLRYACHPTLMTR